ncbi:predicted MFS family arabinose efflux permease [Ureibacillus xyleni]|uniref:Predicted MFS family arabinose efflux permease n=1 Tax=Ureibacillus xyleni TaxID=614648 RepID=A0A285SGA4_9BACL|nr:MFS transporter [Ureibacillus xyleni]SOC06410.1 predicted MFS family arabinose efflux permease [Ureibacillus xyleni]
MDSLLIRKENRDLSKTFALTLFLAGIFMGALDHGIVGPAFSSINQFFGIEASWGVWSFTIYTLFFSVSIPLMGKLSDRFGRKKIFLIGIALFGLGSIIAAFSPTFITFLLGRMVQAIGTGGIFPIVGAFIAVSYPEATRAKMLGLIGVVFGLGTILGPIVGGFIIGSTQWQWIFLVNVPISIIILLFMAPIKINQQIVKKPIDLYGMFILVGIIFTIMLGITLINGWLLFIGIALIPLFIKVEKKALDPVFNINYFKNFNTLFVLILSLLSGFIMASTINLLPFFIETQFSLDKSYSAISVTPLAVASMIASLVGGYLVKNMGAKKAVGIGFSLTFISAVLIAFSHHIFLFFFAITLIGFGIGIIIGSPLNVIMIQNVQQTETGSAIGYLSLARSMGSTMGPTIAGILIAFSSSGYIYVNILIAIFSLISLFVLILNKK